MQQHLQPLQLASVSDHWTYVAAEYTGGLHHDQLGLYIQDDGGRVRNRLLGSPVVWWMKGAVWGGSGMWVGVAYLEQNIPNSAPGLGVIPQRPCSGNTRPGASSSASFSPCSNYTHASSDIPCQGGRPHTRIYLQFYIYYR